MKTPNSFLKAIVALIFALPFILTAQNPIHLGSPETKGEYCIPISDCSEGDGFEDFAIMDIDNYFSACSDNGYGDFIWMFTQLTAGESYSLYAETNFDGNFFSVWIDYNDDFEFSSDELIVEDVCLEFGGQLYSVEVMIPEDAITGVHRMRAKAVFDETSTDPCADAEFGETEDYTVEIVDGTTLSDIGIISIDIGDVISPGPIFPKLTLQNFGTTTFTQLISITNGGTYGTSAFVYDMYPGEVRQITFGEWDAPLGNYTFHSYLSFGDDNLDNNQLFKEVTVEVPNVDPPQNPVAQLQGNTVVLNWDAPSGKNVHGYRVYNNEIRVADSLTQTTFTDLCLVNGNYNYTVTALYSLGESPASDTVEVSVDLCELMIFEEGFEEFNGEQQLGVQAQNMGIEYWQCWSHQAGSEEDPFLSGDTVFEGNRSLSIKGLNDVYLDLGGLVEGQYELNFKMYVPADFDGFFGVWKQVYDYSGMEVYFDEDGSGWAIISNSQWQAFSFNSDEWNEIQLVVDLDNDWSKLYINHVMVCQAKWSLQESGEPGLLKLDAIDFYAGTVFGGIPQSFVDQIEITHIIENPLSPENVFAEVSQDTVYLSWDAPMVGDIIYSVLRNGEGIATTVQLGFVDEGLLSGEYQYQIIADYGLCQSLPSVEVSVLVHPVQLIVVPHGWSGMSAYLNPENPDIEAFFQSCVEQLILVQNENGMYWPGENVNTLVDWNSTKGYKIKMDEGTVLSVRGALIEDKTLILSQGWNMIPVLSECDVNIAGLFSGKDVLMVKEIAGRNVYWPDFGITTLEYLQSGKAYFVFMESEGAIEFPDCTSKSSRDNKLKEFRFLPELSQPVSSISHTIALPESVISDQWIGKILAAFNQDDQCFAYTKITGNGDALTVFGDDPTSPESDGFLDGETFTFKIYDAQSLESKAVDFELEKSFPQHEGLFVADGISVVRSLKASVNDIGDGENFRFRLFPNPAKDFINIQIPESSGADVVIVDMQGKEMMRLQYVGKSLRLDVSDLKRGVYALKVFRGGKIHTKKMIIN